MHYKVPAITSYVNEHTAVLRLRPIDGHPHGVVVETAAGGRVELPAMPGAAEDACAGQCVAAGLSTDTLPDGPQAERAAVVRTAVAHAAQLTVHRDDPGFMLKRLPEAWRDKVLHENAAELYGERLGLPRA